MKLITLLALVSLCAFTAKAQNNANVFNLADFDAVGDGVTDDGPAFQRALDALADAGGGTLQVPAGLYLIRTPVFKDFSGLNGGSVTIQGVPSNKQPAPPTAGGNELSESLDLQSEIFPDTGSSNSAFTISNLKTLRVEHLAFTGKETTITDAYITLNMNDIDDATVFHCEFYGISTFGLVAGQGGGNLIRAVRSNLNIDQLMVLGSTANSGAYAPIIENIHWKGFQISNSIFIDFGIRSFFGKMGLGAPLSWINFASVAPRTPESSRREVVIRDTFLDEGGWIGITAFPHLWGTPVDPIDLIYISGLKMNVSNLGTAGHQFFDVRNILIENSHYGWSHNTGAAIDIYRSTHAILDRLTCIAEADRIRVDDRTERLTVINSVYNDILSQAGTTTEMETAPEDDPVQYVRAQFLSVLGRQPEPAAHFYWSDLLIRCGNNNECLDQQRDALNEYLESNPQSEFSIAGNVVDENGEPVSGATITLSGSQSVVTATGADGNFHFFGLPTTGTYTVTANKRHYTFANDTETFVRPVRDVEVQFNTRLNRHSITGQLGKFTGGGVEGNTVRLISTETISTTTDANGIYTFTDLPAGQNYTIVPVINDFFVFAPVTTTITELAEDRTVNFVARLRPELLTLENSDDALVIDAVSFIGAPISIFQPVEFSDDGLGRMMLFAKNLELVKSMSEVTVTAQDSQNFVHTLPVEFVGIIPGQSWVKQINVRLLPTLGAGKCVQLRVIVDTLESNPARVCFAPPRPGS
jgi:hypothetical protein